MARRVRSAELETRSSRLRLPVAPKPVFVKIGVGVGLGYRRNATAGSWVVRLADGKGGYRTNTIAMAEVSSLLAVAEGARVIERGWADVMIVGGASSRIHPTAFVRATIGEFSRRVDRPSAASRPFDAARDGEVCGEGAAALVLEGRRHAEARAAKVLGRVTGHASAFQPRANGTLRGS